MAKKYRRLQHISTIPVLAALLLTANPSAVVDSPVDGMMRTRNGTNISIPTDTPDSRRRNK